MRGLFIKDLYMMKTYCRMLLVMVLIFTVIGIFSEDNTFFIVYSMFMSAMIPRTLLAYDENEHWDLTCDSLPVSRSRIVSVKYMVGLLCVLGIGALDLILLAFSMKNHFSEEVFFGSLCSVLTMGLLIPSIVLPIDFKFGTAKARIISVFVIACMAGGVAVISYVKESLVLSFSKTGIYGILAVAVCMYAVSWLLSICFYKKREF